MTWQALTVHPLYDERYGENVTSVWRQYGHVRKRTTLACPPHEAAGASGWPSDRTLSNQDIRPGSGCSRRSLAPAQGVAIPCSRMSNCSATGVRSVISCLLRASCSPLVAHHIVSAHAMQRLGWNRRDLPRGTRQQIVVRPGMESTVLSAHLRRSGTRRAMVEHCGRDHAGR